jgi:hypothetical protein
MKAYLSFLCQTPSTAQIVTFPLISKEEKLVIILNAINVFVS